VGKRKRQKQEGPHLQGEKGGAIARVFWSGELWVLHSLLPRGRERGKGWDWAWVGDVTLWGLHSSTAWCLQEGGEKITVCSH
jgi:hypothetical protein